METSMVKLIVLLVSCQILCCQAHHVVSTLNGKIQGAHVATRNGRNVNTFTRIPYAKPPVGPLRFKEPQPPEPWKEPLDGTKDGSICPQLNLYHLGRKGGPKLLGQEDCLHLNVYSPKLDQNAKLPVMVFIHGGGFMQGHGTLYGPEYLLDRDIVLVTMNYRLGALGFASTLDDTIPANLAMKDQALAIKWVHDNIDKFGGDPNLVTVFGESAGGDSTHLHLLSPLSKGLIHRGIAMSGTAFCPWSIVSPQLLKDRTKALATLAGCPLEPSNELLECMQTAPVNLLLDLGNRFQDWVLSPVIIFGPTIESEKTKGAFLTTYPGQLESRVPLLTGINSGEGVVAASIILSSGDQYLKELKEHPQYILPKLLMLRTKFPKSKVPTVSKQVEQFYFGDKPVDKNSTEELIQMASDSWFLEGAVTTANNYSGDAYFYYYDYQQSVSYSSVFGSAKTEGVCHSDSLLNLFPLLEHFPNRTLSQTDIKVSDQVIDIWTNFAKTGKPTDDKLKLEPTGKSSKSNKYLKITKQGPTVEENLLPKRVEFWTSLNKLQARR